MSREPVSVGPVELEAERERVANVSGDGRAERRPEAQQHITDRRLSVRERGVELVGLGRPPLHPLAIGVPELDGRSEPKGERGVGETTVTDPDSEGCASRDVGLVAAEKDGGGGHGNGGRTRGRNRPARGRQETAASLTIPLKAVHPLSCHGSPRPICSVPGTRRRASAWAERSGASLLRPDADGVDGERRLRDALGDDALLGLDVGDLGVALGGGGLHLEPLLGDA